MLAKWKHSSPLCIKHWTLLISGYKIQGTCFYDSVRTKIEEEKKVFQFPTSYIVTWCASEFFPTLHNSGDEN